MTYPTPTPQEFAPYYQRYAALVPDGDILATLRTQADDYLACLRGVPDARRTYRYGPDKWSLAESLLHVIDTERVFAYRAMRIARGDTTPLPGFEQDEWIPTSEAATRRLGDLADEFRVVRAATVALLTGLPAAAWDRVGTASGHAVSVRGLAFITAGHAQHHLDLFRIRYLT
jgi:hypothetical protein